MRCIAGAVALTVACCLGAPAAAVEFLGGQHVTVEAGEIVSDDLYASGETVVVDGTVEGDLVAVGRHIVVNGTVTGDLIAAGQGIVVNGGVGDDARIAGMALRLGESAAIGDDLIAAGFSLETAPGSLVSGSLLVRGFQALLGGELEGRLDGGLAALTVDGPLRGGGEVEVEGDDGPPPFAQFLPTPVPMPAVAPGLTFGPNAALEETLVYRSPVAVSADPALAARLQHVVAARPAPAAAAEAATSAPPGQRRWARALKRKVATLLVGFLVLAAAPVWISGRSAYLASRPLAAAGWGLLTLLTAPAVLLVLALAIIVVGVVLGLIQLGSLVGPVLAAGFLGEGALVVALWWSLALLAPIVVALWTGRLILARGGEERSRFASFAVGWLALTVVSLVPFIGGLVGFVVAVVGLGTLVAWVPGLFRGLAHAPASGAA